MFTVFFKLKANYLSVLKNQCFYIPSNVFPKLTLLFKKASKQNPKMRILSKWEKKKLLIDKNNISDINPSIQFCYVL